MFSTFLFNADIYLTLVPPFTRI